jgi:hypothetical protein
MSNLAKTSKPKVARTIDGIDGVSTPLPELMNTEEQRDEAREFAR